MADPVDARIHLAFDDVFGALDAYSEPLRVGIMNYLLATQRGVPPRLSESDRAAVESVLPWHHTPYRAESGRSLEQHLAARRKLHSELVALGPEGDELIVRFGLVLESLTGHDEGIPPFPNSIACLIRDFAWARLPRMRGGLSTGRMVRLLESEGFDGPDARSLVVQLLLDAGLTLAGRYAGLRNDWPGALELLQDSEFLVRSFLEQLDPRDITLVLQGAEKDEHLAVLAAPTIVRAVAEGEAWIRPQLLAVLRSTQLSAYREVVEQQLRSCTTAQLPRVIAIVEQLEDSVTAAEILTEASNHSKGIARRRLMDAAISRLLEVTFAPLSFVPRVTPFAGAIVDSPLSDNDVDALRAAMEHCRRRALSRAQAKSRRLEDKWHRDAFQKDIAEALQVAKECEEALSDLAPVIRALEGHGPLPLSASVVDRPLVAQLVGLTLAQKIRLVANGSDIRWSLLAAQCPLPGVSARTIVDFATAAGFDARSVGLSLVRLALSHGPLFVVTAEAMWTVLVDYLPELDRVLGLAVDTDSYRDPDEVMAAVQLFAASSKPLPRYLPAISALARGRRGPIRDAARDALRKYGITVDPEG